MRIVLADDEPTVRSALNLILEQNSEFRVVGEAATAQELLGVLCDTSPDLILLDWELPGLDPSAPLTELRGLRPRVCVIAMSSRPDIGALTQDAGCQAFVSKGDPPERLLAAVASVRTP